MTPEELAQIAYEAWCNEAQPIDWRGHLSWAGLRQRDRDAWLAAVTAVKSAVLGPMTRVNEM